MIAMEQEAQQINECEVVEFTCSYCGARYQLFQDDSAGAVARTVVNGCSVCQPAVQMPAGSPYVATFPLIKLPEGEDGVPRFIIGPPEGYPVGH